VQDLGECVGTSVWDCGRDDRWGTQQTFPVQAGEYFGRCAEEDGEAEGEVVGAVARVGEELAGDLEVALPNGDEDTFFV
jgi:hypothetical protein